MFKISMNRQVILRKLSVVMRSKSFMMLASTNTDPNASIKLGLGLELEVLASQRCYLLHFMVVYLINFELSLRS